MSKVEDLEITQEMMTAAVKVFVAVAVQTNSTNTTVKFSDFTDNEGKILGDFTFNCKWHKPTLPPIPVNHAPDLSGERVIVPLASPGPSLAEGEATP